MDKQTLIDNRNAVENKFNEVQEQVKQGNEELIRLQGEYRALTALIDAPESEHSFDGTETLEPKKKASK